MLTVFAHAAAHSAVLPPQDTALSSIGAPEPKGSALYFERFFYSFASGLLPSAGVLFNEADRAGIARHEEAILGFLAQGLGSPPVMREFISRGMLAGRPIGDAGASSVAVLLEMEQLEGSGAWVVGRDALPASRVSLAGVDPPPPPAPPASPLVHPHSCY